MLNQDTIREATRLTRAGQLVEATALLQRMLRGEPAPDASSDTGGRIALAGPLIIDAKANPVEETDSPPQSEPATSAQPRIPRTFLDRKEGRSGIGLRGVIKRAPLSTPTSCRRAPGSSKVHTAVPREAAPTGSSSRAAIGSDRFRWASCFTAAPSRRMVSPPARG